MVGNEVADAQIVNRHRTALEIGLAGGHPGVARVPAVVVAVLRDHAAQADARARIQVRQHRFEHFAADVFEIDVDAVGTGGGKIVHECLAAV